MRQLVGQARDLGFKARDGLRCAGYARVQLGLELFKVGQCARFARSL